MGENRGMDGETGEKIGGKGKGPKIENIQDRPQRWNFQTKIGNSEDQT